ncbi:zinc finger and BTB domain-containing protein 47-like [Cottoperca gobio]|uniref:Zinc finger and BTB domain-containing protein 47-like n=1 Tax=Cottoperca gobio TaxID=56716 RepID=A0A6J2Q2B9_COTGO|nr:zinc finger and BTB domain-containing protein 47-like [Cottoperca gobio]
MKTPPDRSGITFEVGAQLEARDRHKNWYSYKVCFYDGVVLTVKPTKVKPFQEKSRSEKSAVGSEGWEEGESEEEEEEEDGGEREEERKEEEMENVTSEEKEGAEEEERKRKAEPSSSHPPAKKKADDGRSGGAQNQPITADSTQPAPPDPASIDKGKHQRLSDTNNYRRPLWIKTS